MLCNKDKPPCVYDILQDMEGCLKVTSKDEDGKRDFNYKLI